MFLDFSELRQWCEEEWVNVLRLKRGREKLINSYGKSLVSVFVAKSDSAVNGVYLFSPQLLFEVCRFIFWGKMTSYYNLLHFLFVI